MTAGSETISQVASQAVPRGSIGQALRQSANFILDIFRSGLNLAIPALMLMQMPFKTTLGRWVLIFLMFSIILVVAALLGT